MLHINVLAVSYLRRLLIHSAGTHSLMCIVSDYLSTYSSRYYGSKDWCIPIDS